MKKLFLLIFLFLGITNLFSQPKAINYDSLVHYLKEGFHSIEWQRKYLNDNLTINASFFSPQGNIWMGGSSEFIYYSSDFGKSWIKKPNPLKDNNSISYIFMLDSLNGLAGGWQNSLSITKDNWQTAKKIPTPLDQKQLNITETSLSSTILKVEMNDSIILINQNGQFFFSPILNINWKNFNIPVLEFMIDNTNQSVKLFSTREKVLLLDSRLRPKHSYIDSSFSAFYPIKLPDNQIIDLENFLKSNIVNVKIHSHFKQLDGFEDNNGCLLIAKYKEEVKNIKIKDKQKLARLSNLLQKSVIFQKPKTENFVFDSLDFVDFYTFLATKADIVEYFKNLGETFTSKISKNHPYFSNPEKVIANTSQSHFNNIFDENYWLFFGFLKPIFTLEIINSKGDTLKISNQEARFANLPWQLELNGKTRLLYNIQINRFLQENLSPKLASYNYVFAGELIYRLIMEKIIAEVEY